MNSYFDLITDINIEIENILNNESKIINDKYFEFLILMMKLQDNKLNIDEFIKEYKLLFNDLSDLEKETFDKITKLFIKDFIEIKDKYNLWNKENVTLKKERK